MWLSSVQGPLNLAGACVEPLQPSGLCVSGLAGALLSVLLRRKCALLSAVIPGVCRQDNQSQLITIHRCICLSVLHVKMYEIERTLV